EVAGHRGDCTLHARAEAGAAAVLVAAAGSLPDVFRVLPRFEVSRALAQATTRELEQEAVRDGLERAASLARAAGVRAGAVLRIAEPGSRHDDGMVVYSRMAYSGAPGEIDPDDIGELVPEPEVLSARVLVTVALEPPG
ncbi:MAG: SIMPL domain-containing protein, partial [Thermoleophilia bacterium]